MRQPEQEKTMGLPDMLKKTAAGAAYMAGYGAGKASRAIQDAAANPATQSALASVRDAALKTADAADALAEKMAPTFRSFVDRAAPALQDLVDRAAAAVKDAAVAGARDAVPGEEAPASPEPVVAWDPWDAQGKAKVPVSADDPSQVSGWKYPDASA